jgi:hypothetical protein
VERLDRVAKGRSVLFEEDIRSHFDDVIRTNPKEEPVKGFVMQMAEGKTIANDGLPLGFFVRNDVGGVEKFVMPESA